MMGLCYSKSYLGRARNGEDYENDRNKNIVREKDVPAFADDYHGSRLLDCSGSGDSADSVCGHRRLQPLGRRQSGHK